jgi:hypothetical protein
MQSAWMRTRRRSKRLVRPLERAEVETGLPKTIRLDNGPEFVSYELDGAVTLPREERERSTPCGFQAAATASRHVVIAAARSTRCD